MIAMGGVVSAAPALTTIQDILYKADGSRFNGTLTITWENFQAGDDSVIPTQAVTVNVVNGVLKVQLIPTTNASAGSSYSVNYASQGRYQFTETWAVLPSSTPIRLRDVRVGSGVVVGPPPVLAQMQISDVAGLATELTARPMRGVSFDISRTAVINSAGQLDAAQGNLGDCVHVDGTSGPCGSGGGGAGAYAGFVDSETPAGLVNGTNTNFTLNYPPSPAASVAFYRNGILMKQNSDYTLTGNTVHFLVASVPQSGDLIQASYRYADPTNPLSSMATPQVICSSAGTSTNTTTLTSLGTCRIPANLLQTGDRLELRFEAVHQGTASGYTLQAAWGATTMLSRNGVTGDSAIAARIDAGVYANGAQWSVQSWNSTGALTVGIGTASDSLASELVINFSGQLATASADAVILRNFTVIRYPAQSRP